jgi:hypothetical protein
VIDLVERLMRVCIRTASLVTLKDDAIRISVGLLNGEGIGDDDFKEITSLFFATVKVRAEPARVRARAQVIHTRAPPQPVLLFALFNIPNLSADVASTKAAEKDWVDATCEETAALGRGKTVRSGESLNAPQSADRRANPPPRPALSRLCAQSFAAARRARNHITYNYLAQALLQAPAASDEQKDAVFVSMTQLRAFHQLVGTAYR